MLRVIICFSTRWHTDIGTINLPACSRRPRLLLQIAQAAQFHWWNISLECQHIVGTLLVITTFTHGCVTERRHATIDGLQFLSDSAFAYRVPCIVILKGPEKLIHYNSISNSFLIPQERLLSTFVFGPKLKKTDIYISIALQGFPLK